MKINQEINTVVFALVVFRRKGMKHKQDDFKEAKRVKLRYATRKFTVGVVSVLVGFTFIFEGAVSQIPVLDSVVQVVEASEVDQGRGDEDGINLTIGDELTDDMINEVINNRADANEIKKVTIKSKPDNLDKVGAEGVAIVSVEYADGNSEDVDVPIFVVAKEVDENIVVPGERIMNRAPMMPMMMTRSTGGKRDQYIQPVVISTPHGNVTIVPVVVGKGQPLNEDVFSESGPGTIRSDKIEPSIIGSDEPGWTIGCDGWDGDEMTGDDLGPVTSGAIAGFLTYHEGEDDEEQYDVPIPVIVVSDEDLNEKPPAVIPGAINDYYYNNYKKGGESDTLGAYPPPKQPDLQVIKPEDGWTIHENMNNDAYGFYVDSNGYLRCNDKGKIDWKPDEKERTINVPIFLTSPVGMPIYNYTVPITVTRGYGFNFFSRPIRVKVGDYNAVSFNGEYMTNIKSRVWHERMRHKWNEDKTELVGLMDIRDKYWVKIRVPLVSNQHDHWFETTNGNPDFGEHSGTGTRFVDAAISLEMTDGTKQEGHIHVPIEVMPYAYYKSVNSEPHVNYGEEIPKNTKAIEFKCRENGLDDLHATVDGMSIDDDGFVQGMPKAIDFKGKDSVVINIPLEVKEDVCKKDEATRLDLEELFKGKTEVPIIVHRPTTQTEAPTTVDNLVEGNKNVEVELPNKATVGDDLNIKVEGNLVKTVKLTKEQLEKGKAIVEVDNPLLVDQQVTSTVTNHIGESEVSNTVIVKPIPPVIEKELNDGEKTVEVKLPDTSKAGYTVKVQVDGSPAGEQELSENDIKAGKVSVKVNNPLKGRQTVVSTIVSKKGTESNLSNEKVVKIAPPTITNNLKGGEKTVEITLPNGLKTTDKIAVKVDGDEVKTHDLSSGDISSGKITVTLDNPLLAGQKVTSTVVIKKGVESKSSNEKVVTIERPAIENDLIGGGKRVVVTFPQGLREKDKIEVFADGEKIGEKKLTADEISKGKTTVDVTELIGDQKVTAKIVTTSGIKTKPSDEKMVTLEKPKLDKELSGGDTNVEVTLPKGAKEGDTVKVTVGGNKIGTKTLTDEEAKSGTVKVPVTPLVTDQVVTSSIVTTGGHEYGPSNEKTILPTPPTITNELKNKDTEVQVKLPKGVKKDDVVKVYADGKEVGEHKLTEGEAKEGTVINITTTVPLEGGQEVISKVVTSSGKESAESNKKVVELDPPTITNELKGGGTEVQVTLPKGVKPGNTVKVIVDNKVIGEQKLTEDNAKEGEVIKVTTDNPLLGDQKVTAVIVKNDDTETGLSNEKVVTLNAPKLEKNLKGGAEKVKVTLPKGVKKGDTVKVFVGEDVIGEKKLEEGEAKAGNAVEVPVTPLIGDQKVVSKVVTSGGETTGNSNEELVTINAPELEKNLKGGAEKVKVTLPKGVKKGDTVKVFVGEDVIGEKKLEEGEAKAGNAVEVPVTPLIGDQKVVSKVVTSGGETTGNSNEELVTINAPKLENGQTDGDKTVEVTLPAGVKENDTVKVFVDGKEAGAKNLQLET